MFIASKAFVKAVIFFTTMLLLSSVAHGQELTVTSGSVTSPEEEKSNAQATAAAPQVANTQPTPATDFLSWEEMTGDWGGTRSRLKAKGFDSQFELTQFFQGVASGGINTG